MGHKYQLQANGPRTDGSPEPQQAKRPQRPKPPTARTPTKQETPNPPKQPPEPQTRSETPTKPQPPGRLLWACGAKAADHYHKLPQMPPPRPQQPQQQRAVPKAHSGGALRIILGISPSAPRMKWPVQGAPRSNNGSSRRMALLMQASMTLCTSQFPMTDSMASLQVQVIICSTAG